VAISRRARVAATSRRTTATSRSRSPNHNNNPGRVANRSHSNHSNKVVGSVSNRAMAMHSVSSNLKRVADSATGSSPAKVVSQNSNNNHVRKADNQSLRADSPGLKVVTSSARHVARVVTNREAIEVPARQGRKVRAKKESHSHLKRVEEPLQKEHKIKEGYVNRILLCL